MFSVPDIMPIIINNLNIKDISSFRQLCKEANTIFSWPNYFLSNVSIPEAYKEHNIDEKFMKEHGKHLIHISDIHIVKQWFDYKYCVGKMLSIYDYFIGSHEKILDIYINYANDVKYSITYNKKFNILVTTNYMKETTYYETDIKDIICNKIREGLLFSTIIKINVQVDYNDIYLVSTGQ